MGASFAPLHMYQYFRELVLVMSFHFIGDTNYLIWAFGRKLCAPTYVQYFCELVLVNISLALIR